NAYAEGRRASAAAQPALRFENVFQRAVHLRYTARILRKPGIGEYHDHGTAILQSRIGAVVSAGLRRLGGQGALSTLRRLSAGHVARAAQSDAEPWAALRGGPAQIAAAHKQERLGTPRRLRLGSL